MTPDLWKRVNALAESGVAVGRAMGLWVWEKSGRRPGVIFFGALGAIVGGLVVQGLAARWAWNELLFPADALAEMTPAVRFAAEAVPVLVKAGIVFNFYALSAMFWIWMERKVSARIQSRHGPMHTGGWHGWSQSLADGIKLVSKEDLIPRDADPVLFRFAPYLIVAGAAVPFLTLPFGFGPFTTVLDLDIGVYFVIAVLSLEVIGVVLSGWASNNKWSVLGGLRQAAQVVVYEIPLGLTLLVPVLYVGSLRFTDITVAQNGPVWNWLLFRDPFCFVSFLLFFTAALAGSKRAPFDLPEAESELTAGFHTEYSGIRFVFFFMAEYGTMYLLSAAGAVLWLGGPNLGVWTWAADMPFAWKLAGPFVLPAKAFALIFVQMWLRWTLPRLRVDQVLHVCLKVLLPWSVVALFGAAVWRFAVAPVPADVGLARWEAEWPAWGIIVDVLTRLALMGLTAAVIALLIGEAVLSRRVSRLDEKTFGPAWRTWGGRVTSDHWAAGYDWRDPEHRKPSPQAVGSRQV